MASYTTNLNLKKPAGSENVAIGDINGNMDTIDSAYGAVNSQIAKVNGYWTIINSTVITTSYTTYSTYNSRVISDYVLLSISAILGDWDVCSMLIPQSIFAGGQNVAMFFHDGSNTIEVDIKYKSDTSVEAKYSGTVSGNVKIRIIGLINA